MSEKYDMGGARPLPSILKLSWNTGNLVHPPTEKTIMAATNKWKLVTYIFVT
tara:strand:+ start:255 stop:410 length:156 start_codon:yes stop_codon:yes gene_type:complete